MERDFMGLKTATVKTEVPEETTDSAPLRGSTMQWSFSNKASANPQFFSFEGAGAGAGAKDDKPKTGFEALATTGLVTITTTEAVDSSQKPYSSVVQKNMMILDKQGGTHYTATTYPSKPFDALSVHRPLEARGIPLTTQTKQTVSVTMPAPVHQYFTSPAGQNLIGSTTPQPLPAPSSIPVVNSVSPLVGSTELRSTSKTSGAPAQLTIFYAGSVCVYDDISPEKAQAIMLLAGNAPPVPSPPVPTVAAVPAVPISPVQAPMVRPSIVESFAVNQSNNAKPCISSPISITCHTPGRSVIPNDATAMRTIGTLATPSKGEPSKNASPLGSAPASLIASAAVPQFRKASLARFLEKRKERTLSASPYANKPSEECGSPASGGRSISVNSSGSCPLPAIN
ncbi:protein TIFY 6B-like isoform X2 [Coffea arabica]|uniref:Protein TIFY n=1 Tax=Coffea arabica TaxID=13443 RepID=A0A6P6X671_COFAR